MRFPCLRRRLGAAAPVRRAGQDASPVHGAGPGVPPGRLPARRPPAVPPGGPLAVVVLAGQAPRPPTARRAAGRAPPALRPPGPPPTPRRPPSATDEPLTRRSPRDARPPRRHAGGLTGETAGAGPGARGPQAPRRRPGPAGPATLARKGWEEQCVTQSVSGSPRVADDSPGGPVRAARGPARRRGRHGAVRPAPPRPGRCGERARPGHLPDRAAVHHCAPRRRRRPHLRLRRHRGPPHRPGQRPPLPPARDRRRPRGDLRHPRLRHAPPASSATPRPGSGPWRCACARTGTGTASPSPDRR